MDVFLNPITGIDGQNRGDIGCIGQEARHLVVLRSLCLPGSNRYGPLERAKFP